MPNTTTRTALNHKQPALRQWRFGNNTPLRTYNDPFPAEARESLDIRAAWHSSTLQPWLEKTLGKTLIYHDDTLSGQLLDKFKRIVEKTSAARIYLALAAVARKYNQETGGGLARAMEKKRHERSEVLAERLVSHVKRLNLQPQCYLDIGSGEGDITAQVSFRLGLSSTSAFGLDIYQPKSSSEAFSAISYEQGKVPTLPCPPDLVTLGMVLHHVGTPQGILKILQSTHDLMANGGWLIVREHNVDEDETLLANRINHQLFVFVSRFFPKNMPQDASYLSKQALINLATQAGFCFVESIAEDASPLKPTYYFFQKAEHPGGTWPLSASPRSA